MLLITRVIALVIYIYEKTDLRNHKHEGETCMDRRDVIVVTVRSLALATYAAFIR